RLGDEASALYSATAGLTRRPQSSTRAIERHDGSSRGGSMSIKLRDHVVVITGASSGIGRATAHLFASRGATVVLAARRPPSLEEAAVECERLGGRALPVPTDVRDERAVSELAHRAALRFGRIDVWVNSAAVMTYERFPEAPLSAFHRVVETNLFGYVHGAA